MDNIDIVHIYSGTSGIAGLYIDVIHEPLRSSGFSQECFVSTNFPFDYGKKVYYRFTELAKPRWFYKFSKIRQVFRYFELIIASARVFYFVIKKKPRVVNYSLTNQFMPEYLLLSAINKFTCTKLLLTVHDAIPFDVGYGNYEAFVQKRNRFYKLADKLVVHNENSIKDLQDAYKIDLKKIISYPFPAMDLNRYQVKSEVKLPFSKDKFSFLFVGHLRKEKGIDVLLHAWSIIPDCKKNNIELVIAGNIPSNTGYATNQRGVKFLGKFLSDDDYVNYIMHSDCVVLPYTRGTNSGIPFSVVSVGTFLITSDIDMFRYNPILQASTFFENGNGHDLSNKMIKAMENPKRVLKLKAEMQRKLIAYEKDYGRRLVEQYRLLLNHS